MNEKPRCCARVLPPGAFQGADCANPGFLQDARGRWFCKKHDPAALEAEVVAYQIAEDAEDAAKAARQRKRADIAAKLAMFDELVERLGKAATFVNEHSEPWYKSGQELLLRLRETLAKAEQLR